MQAAGCRVSIKDKDKDKNKAARNTSDALFVGKSPDKKKAINMQRQPAPCTKVSQPDAISHDKANPRSGPVRGLGSLTNCAYPTSRPALRARTPGWTAPVGDNGRRLKLHEEKKV